MTHQASVHGLTPRYWQVMALVNQGLKNADIAQAVGTSENVIKNYLRTIYDQTGMWNRTELALWYEAHGHERPGHPSNDLISGTLKGDPTYVHT